MRVPIRFGRLRPLFVVLGLTPGRSFLDVEPDTVRVRMGWGFAADVPRTSISSACRVADAPWSIGVHGWRGRWIVNGAAGPLVALELDPPVRARTLGIAIRVHELRVSVDDPDGLVMLLGADARRHPPGPSRS